MYKNEFSGKHGAGAGSGLWKSCRAPTGFQVQPGQIPGECRTVLPIRRSAYYGIYRIPARDLKFRLKLCLLCDFFCIMHVIKFHEKNPEKSAQMSSKRVLPMERLAHSLASTMQA